MAPTREASLCPSRDPAHATGYVIRTSFIATDESLLRHGAFKRQSLATCHVHSLSKSVARTTNPELTRPCAHAGRVRELQCKFVFSLGHVRASCSTCVTTCLFYRYTYAREFAKQSLARCVTVSSARASYGSKLPIPTTLKCPHFDENNNLITRHPSTGV